MPESDKPIGRGEVSASTRTATVKPHSTGMALWKLTFHDFLDIFSGFIICGQVIFSPWAFGTCDHWAIWTMNVMGFFLGLLLLFKLAVRYSTEYQFPRWDRFVGDEDGVPGEGWFAGARLAFIACSGLLVLYCFLHAWNAKATVDMSTFTLKERACIPWLPHSFDAPSSWEAFWRYLALALSFWAIHDWLMGKSTRETRRRPLDSQTRHSVEMLPDRLSWLLWVICINGAILGLEGIFQRTSGSNYLLFIKLPPEQVQVVGQFGPYAYRANACQYFNLLWPACLGLWWALRRGRHQAEPGLGVRLRPLALISAAIMALCPLIATSRLGALTAAVSIIASAVVIWNGTRSSDRKLRFGIVGVAVLVLAVGILLGWDHIENRLSDASLEYGLDMRNTMYELATPMASDNPIFGTGPGTFANLYFLYRKDPGEDWFAQLHNDWLETQITFGWVGLGLIAITFFVLISRWFSIGTIGGGRRVPMLLWIAIAGAFLEARWDFPFQIYSVIFAFMLVCSVLFVLSRYRCR